MKCIVRLAESLLMGVSKMRVLSNTPTSRKGSAHQSEPLENTDALVPDSSSLCRPKNELKRF